jgi:proton glutamate symport protein
MRSGTPELICMEVTSNKPSSINLSTFVLVALGAGILAGTVLNLYFPAYGQPLDQYLLTPVGKAFLRLIQFVVIPIVFSSLVLGLTRVRDAVQVGRYALKLMLCFAISSALSVCLGLVTALVFHPGTTAAGLTLPEPTQTMQNQSILDWAISLIPVNPIAALSTGNLIQTIFSAALVGVGIQLAGDKANPFVVVVESIYDISEKILSVILYTAPFGVFALIASVIATQGFEVIANLLFYVLDLLLASTVMIGNYLLVLAVLKAKPIRLLQSLAPALSLAFGTGSSNAALPIVLQGVQEGYGLRQDIASFAIPLGTALKRDGSAILQSFNALFIAQIYHVPITSERVIAIALSAFLVSFSTPGVPGSALITMTTVLSAAGLPLEGVAIVAAVDRFTDGFKSVLNVIGNVSNAIILSHWETEKEPRPQQTQRDDLGLL